MSEKFEYVDNVAQANLILKKCFETIDRLNDEIYTEKIIVGSRYRETIKKLKTKNAKFPEMDLRDYFAAKAMQGLLSNPKLQEQILKQGQDWIIESSYAWANSMMKERENDNQ
mgnify:CR=1 FL=1